MTEPQNLSDFASPGFFVFRTPLLPFDEFVSWSEGMESPAATNDPARLEQVFTTDVARLRARLYAMMSRPELREALFIGSPELDESFDFWVRDPESERGQRIERALVRYFVRMTGRATPFGLFAGCSVGSLDAITNLSIVERKQYRRHARLDMDYLCALTEALGRELKLRRTLVYYPNSSLYRAAGRARYVESRFTGKARAYYLIAVEDTAYLNATLTQAKNGAHFATLAGALANEGTSLRQAEDYIDELIESQILVSKLTPAVTGPEPTHKLVSELREYAVGSQIVDRLEQTRSALDALDALPLGVKPVHFRAIARSLEGLPTKVEMSRLFQVDMIKPSVHATISQEVIAEIVRGVHILHRTTRPGGPDVLRHFREAFVERFGTAEVPLAVALDEEVGVGFESSKASSADGSPLLEGLFLPRSPEEETPPWSIRETILLRRLAECLLNGTQEIVLGSRDLEGLEVKGSPALPDAFAVTASLAADSEAALEAGDFRIVLGGVFGSGAHLLGRFCHMDETLRQNVEQLIRAEEALEPNAVFAEIVHLPEGRIGNILCRPLLRGYEIPYLGRSGASQKQQIPITDLRVSVIGQRIILRSARLEREVIPRLTSAHNYARRSLAVYRFLCALQSQGVAGGLHWSWGPLENAPFLPRVATGRLVMSRARWRLNKDELRALGDASGAAQFQAADRLRARRKLPRFVLLRDGDNELPVDFDNALSVGALAHLIRRREQAVFVEMFPGPGQLCARGPEGRFVHELVVPFVRLREAEHRNLSSVGMSPPPMHRTFPPGSEWLYVKLYTGVFTADRVLRELVSSITDHAFRTGGVDRWFFIRYADPHWHVRLRIHGDPEKLHAEILPVIEAMAAQHLSDGSLWRLQLDTYDREIERYGGAEGIVLAEKIFHADSEAVLAVIRTLAGDEGADTRWRLALLGIDMLLADLGFDLNSKRVLIRRLQEMLAKEFKVGKEIRIQLSNKYRKERAILETLLDPTSDGERPVLPGLEALRRRSDQLAPVMSEMLVRERGGWLTLPLAELAASYVHMHANRMLRSDHRAQELVLYDFLDRLYESQAARGKRPSRLKPDLNPHWRELSESLAANRESPR